jgi:hypothetical protein
MAGRKGILSLLLFPLFLWPIQRPPPPVYPTLQIEGRLFSPGEKVLVMAGLPLRVGVETGGGSLSLGKDPSFYQGKGTKALFCQKDGFMLEGNWGRGGCVLLKKEILWEGDPKPMKQGGRYILSLQEPGEYTLEVTLRLLWSCEVRGPRGMRIEKVKEEGRGRFPVHALHAVGAWYESLYIAAYGDEDKALQKDLDHLNYLMGLMERQIVEENKGLVRLNLLAFKAALEDAADRMEEMEKEGMEAQLLVKLLPTWKMTETVETWEGEAHHGYLCWREAAKAMGLGQTYPFLFPSRALAHPESWEKDSPPEVSPGPLLFYVDRWLSCGENWQRAVARVSRWKGFIGEVNENMIHSLMEYRKKDIQWVPWSEVKGGP